MRIEKYLGNGKTIGKVSQILLMKVKWGGEKVPNVVFEI